MKLSVFTVATPEHTPEELCTLAAKVGIRGLEWRCADMDPALVDEEPSFWGNNRATLPLSANEEELARFDNAVREAGLETVAVTPYVQCGDLEGTETVYRLAKRLGADRVRVGVPAYNRTRPYGELYDEASLFLTQVEELSRTYGIKALVETHHNTIVPSASLAHRLVSAHNPEYVGVLYDPGNMVIEGYENYRMGLELLGPYLAHVHIKNAGWIPDANQPNTEIARGISKKERDIMQPLTWSSTWLPVASGIVPWKQVLADLKAVGYEGWYGVEDFSGSYASEDMLKNYVNQINQWMEELA
ncbi:xylose isomerase [Paenibacillus swuensis]|uniref:Xylose isomerase n=2 Tax=Paenibacillus swuensis TaxID=1178515 RepID=A0A172TNF4_9BACL|nr:sugar phosphate isomerase/epimerase [Paenibacillus swuensis]ANE48619.1 xylose isomerase [Paenibacillus swuensis]